jgi:peptide/nickel transport system permease protein
MPTWSTMTASRNSYAALGVAARGLTGVVLTLLALLVVTFALSRLSPVDAALARVGDHASRSTYLQARHELGLDDPWMIQLKSYVLRLAHGDLGVSTSTGQPVGEELRRVLPATAELATLSMAISAVAGIALAMLAVRHLGGVPDAVIRIISLIGNSVPIFWLGLLALFVFYARLQWLGGPGRLDDAYEYTIDMPTGMVLIDAWQSHVPGALLSATKHLALPVLTLAAYAIGNVTRLTRSALAQEMQQEYVVLARAKGAGETRVLLAHVLPNALGVILTVLALTYATLLEGAVLVETVFARPGLGRYLTTALFAGDTPAVMGATLLIGLCFVVVNGVTDLLVRLADPRAA